MTENFERPDWVQQMEPVLETVNEGVLIADDCRRVVFVNAGFIRMTGLRPEDWSGTLSSSSTQTRSGLSSRRKSKRAFV